MAVRTETRRSVAVRLPALAASATLARHAGLAVTIVMAIIAGWWMASGTLQRHDAFRSNAFDLGYFDQLAWNTAHGRWFESSFIEFNFLGQHFEPVLLAFALVYRLGAGPEALLLTAAFTAALAAVPLYLAARRFSGSDIAGVLCAGAFLLSAPLHAALNFDFHPETLCYVFVFTGAAFLAYGRAWIAVVSLLPLLLLKEDMALIVIALALLVALRGYVRPALALAGVAGVWFMVTVFVVMPAIRGDEASDITNRYSYLTRGTTPLNMAPVAASRAAQNVGADTALGLGRLVLSTGGMPLLNPPGFMMAAGLASVTGASLHPEQARLQDHYTVPTLVLLWFAALLSLDTLRRRRAQLPVIASGVMAACAVLTFAASSPFAPWRGYELAAEDAAALHEALALIPPAAPVEAQSTILPHLSQRLDVYEFPDWRRGEYVVLAGSLGVSRQSRANGFEREKQALAGDGYIRLYASRGVEVWRAIR